MEANNMKAMREALIDVVKRLEARVGCDHHTFNPTATTCDGITSVGKCANIATCAAIFKARTALAEPPRNCDVGTPQEQVHRFDEYCRAHRISPKEEDFRTPCDECPILKERLRQGTGCAQTGCIFVWEQMPYEEGGKK